MFSECDETDLERAERVLDENPSGRASEATALRKIVDGYVDINDLSSFIDIIDNCADSYSTDRISSRTRLLLSSDSDGDVLPTLEVVFDSNGRKIADSKTSFLPTYYLFSPEDNPYHIEDVRTTSDRATIYALSRISEFRVRNQTDLVKKAAAEFLFFNKNEMSAVLGVGEVAASYIVYSDGEGVGLVLISIVEDSPGSLVSVFASGSFISQSDLPKLDACRELYRQCSDEIDTLTGSDRHIIYAVDISNEIDCLTI